MMGDAQRLTGLRRQWGQSATLAPGAGPVSVMDATAQNASRFALTVGEQSIFAALDAELIVTSAIESGLWRRTFRVQNMGVVVQVPEGRVTASLRNLGSQPFPWFSAFGEGTVSREWQCFVSPPIIAGDKVTYFAPRYARRLRVAVASGGPLLIDLPGLGSVGTIDLLPPPGGQTVFEIGAVPTLSITNVGAGTSVPSVEWEILG